MKIYGSLVLLVPALLAAQEFRGTVLGRVTDPTGSAIAGASVEAVNIQTNTAVRTTTNEAGNYQIPFLLPGSYTINVEHAGFKRLSRQGVRVSTNDQVTLDLALEIGTATESVTVTAAAPLLTTANADLGGA